jgi:hypothetical protein
VVADRLQFAVEGNARTIPFHIEGEVWAVHTEVMAKGAERRPTRPLAGWLMVYGTLGASNNVIPIRDRQGHTHDAARELGHIDWTPYIEKGSWIDNHRWVHPDGRLAEWGDRPKDGRRVHVGRAHTLQFHDGSTDLSLQHRKVGYFTSGELYDPTDPRSWEGLGRVPTPYEFERSEHYWDLATMLKGTPRSLAFSADGVMALSRDKTQLMWARVGAAGVCEIPQHPATTAEPMELGVPSAIASASALSPLEVMEMALENDDRLRGPAEQVLVRSHAQTPLDDVAGQRAMGLEDRIDHLTEMVMEQFKTDRATARRWVCSYLKDNPHQAEEAFNAQARR